MENVTLVVLAAGMGSRYGGGGMKQVTPVDTAGHFIIDYSIYDAVLAGIDSVVFIIKKEMESDFRATVGKRVEKHINVKYAFQDTNDLPPGFSVPVGRSKPWGTGHAVLSARNAVKGSFITVNADDFYGRQAYVTLVTALRELSDDVCVMAGYSLKDALSETGSVRRALCRMENGFLRSLEEHMDIVLDGDHAMGVNSAGQSVTLPLDALVSLNLLGFHSRIFKDMWQDFENFLNDTPDDRLLTAEYYLPDFVQSLINGGRTRVLVRPANSRWHGVTYQKDRDTLVQAIAEYITDGIYPERLWVD